MVCKLQLLNSINSAFMWEHAFLQKKDASVLCGILFSQFIACWRSLLRFLAEVKPMPDYCLWPQESISTVEGLEVSKYAPILISNEPLSTVQGVPLYIGWCHYSMGWQKRLQSTCRVSQTVNLLWPVSKLLPVFFENDAQNSSTRQKKI